MAWRDMSTARQNGKPILLQLDPPLDTNLVEQWISVEFLPVVVGWWDGQRWTCGYTADEAKDSQGNPPFGPPIALHPVGWQPLPR